MIPAIPLEYMPPLMFAGLVIFMCFGYPVAFSLSAVGLFFGFFAIEWGYFAPAFLQAIPGRIFGSILSNDLLLAIPFFTFMGTILERCGLAEDMLESMGQLFGTVRGGLGYSVIIVGFILGAVTGTVAAQVIAMTLISLPIMMRYKYDMRYATGVLAASGTITQLVPPSLVLVVLADQLGKSVGDMYLGAWGPSLMQIAFFAAYTFLLSIIKPHYLPAIPKEDLTLVGWPLWKKCLAGIVPSAVLIFLVLGTMMFGIATPTEAGAMGAIGAIVLAVVRHKDIGRFGMRFFQVGVLAVFGGVAAFYIAPKSLLFKGMFTVVYLSVAWMCYRAVMITDLRNLLRQAYQQTARITAMVSFILIGSTCFSIVFQGVDGNLWVEHLLSGLPGGAWGFLLVVNLFVFFLAFFLDFFEIAFIIVPMLAPVAQKMLAPIVGDHAALIWFGVILCVNMQTSFMHPPFGFALFYMRGVAPKEVKTTDMYWGAIPFVIMQLIMVAMVVLMPKMVTVFLDADIKVDLDKVRIELPSDSDPGSGDAAKDADEAQKAQEQAFGDLQKSMGGTSAGDAPKDAAPADGAKPPAEDAGKK